MESRKAHALESGGSNPPPAINSVRITLFVYKRSMIQLNLHRSSCAETNDINGRTETTCDYAQTTHGKRFVVYPVDCWTVRKAQ